MPEQRPVVRAEPWRAVGLMDVARVAGVSAMTVSRVVNDREGVGKATRARVEQVMAELGFVPNSSARALKSGRSATLGVVCLASSFYGPSHVLFGVEQSAREQGYATIVATLNVIDVETLGAAVAQLRQSAVEAIVVISPLVSSGEALRRLGADLPTIAIWAPTDVGMAVTGVNHQEAAAAATRHLLDLGHTRIAHVSGPVDWTGSEQRIVGWRAAMQQAGVPATQLRAGDWTAQSGHAAAVDLLASTDTTAVFAANDQMALGVYRAAHRLGRRIPDDLSVVGYDDGPDSEYYTPPLTTMHQDFRRIGERAFRRIHAVIGDGAAPEPGADETPWLVVRESTAPPAA